MARGVFNWEPRGKAGLMGSLEAPEEFGGGLNGEHRSTPQLEGSLTGGLEAPHCLGVI